MSTYHNEIKTFLPEGIDEQHQAHVDPYDDEEVNT